jgi:hypothetical protein
MEEFKFEATTPRIKSSINIARGISHMIVDAETQTPTDGLKFREISRKLGRKSTQRR